MIKLTGTILKSGNDLDYSSSYFGCFINSHSKLNGLRIEGRKCAAAGCDQAFLMVVPL